MHNEYAGVITRFLRKEERLILSEENEMPLVIEANGSTGVGFLQEFLRSHSANLLVDISKYGAVLLRGFDVSSDENFEKIILSIQGFQGISEAFMSEEGRIHVSNLKFVLHTNAVYKTGGTLYIGGFHSENYYTPDVPTYICFCCLKPSVRGGETGLINMEKIYQCLNDSLKNRLEKNTFFVSKWLVSEVADRYHLSIEVIEKMCSHFDLPIVGKGKDKFILMYKPSIFKHPITKKSSLQINLFEIPSLNSEMRSYFIDDYQGKEWFWHRFVWKLPTFIFKLLEFFYIIFASFFYSPKNSIKILLAKIRANKALNKKNNLPLFNDVKVGSCFKDKEIKDLAKLIRNYYSSCLWKKGDILLIDNRKVLHAGMPGSGPRLIRAMICNPLDMKYSFSKPGYLDCRNCTTETIGFYMTSGKFNIQEP